MMESGLRRGRKATWITVLVAALALSLAPPAFSQSQAGTGQIVGVVTDAAGGAVPGATVTATNKATNLSVESQTNEEGQYRVLLLPPGSYTVSVKKTGFKEFRADTVVTVGATLTINPNLVIGEITETIEVVAEATIATTQSQPDALINLRSISNLPINGRRFQDFVTLTPTVQIDQQRGQISFAGQRGINTNVTIDGADYNQPFFGGIRGGERSNTSFTVPQESIAEFQAVPYGYSAEFGRSTGGFLNVVTKSGTNDWHGSGFYFVRHSQLASKDAFDRKALDNLHQWGGSVSGPIRHDKQFMSFAYEQQVNDNPRLVIFRNLNNVTRDAFNGQGFDFYRGQEGPFTQTNDGITFFGRWDQQFNANHRMNIRYNYSKNTALNAVATGNQINPETNNALSNNGTEGDRTHSLTGSWIGSFSPTMINEFRAQYSREDRPRLANSLMAGLGNTVGNTGTRSFLPTTQFDYRLQFTDNLTWISGTHTVRFGGDFNYLFADQFFKFNQFGIYSISGSNVNTVLRIMTPGSAGSGDPANRLDSSSVTYRINIGNGLADMSQQYLAFYVNDTWRITPRFTFNYGLRWEGYFNPEPDASNTVLTSLVRDTVFPLGQVDPAFIPDNLNQWMPRLGFAWDPWGDTKTVIRGNIGYYYARTPLLLFAGPLNNFRATPGDLSIQLPFALPSGFVCTPIATGDTCNTIYWQFRRIGIDLNSVSLDNLPTVTSEQALQIASALGLAVNPFLGAAPLTMADNYESPRSLQWNLGIEREVARGWSVSMDYAWIHTVHLQRNRDFNQPPPVIPATDLSMRPCFGLRGGTPCSPRQRIISSLNAVSLRETNARSLYRAFTFGSTYRRSRLQFQAYYTLGWNYSNDDNERSAGGFTLENAYNLIPEYGFGELDVRHQFLFNTVVDLPWGFTFSSLSRLRSARPIDPTTGSDTNGDFGGPDRPLQAVGVPFTRNSFRDRAEYLVDMRVAKRFNLPREGMSVDITADFFNLFNFHNVRFSNTGRIYGLGIGTNGQPAAIDSRFQRLRNPASCLSATNPTGNKECYDTSTTQPGFTTPFTVQLGARFSF